MDTEESEAHEPLASIVPDSPEERGPQYQGFYGDIDSNSLDYRNYNLSRSP